MNDIDKKYKLDEVINKKQYIKPPKNKAKKVSCKECKYFKFDYYCDKMNKTAPYYYKKKPCNKFTKTKKPTPTTTKE